jgi:hypothetical protein
VTLISSPDPYPLGQVSYCYHWASVVSFLHFNQLLYKTTEPIWTKLWWNGPWVVPFQNCVRQSPPPPRQPRWLSLLKIENLTENHLKIIFSETAGPIGPKLWWNCLQMVLFENCVRRPRPPSKIAAVIKNRKFGKKSLTNYLLWNYWANWAQTMVEWSLGGHLSEFCPTTPTASQDVCHY